MLRRDCSCATMNQSRSAKWIPCNAGNPLPSGAVHVGMDKGGDKLYAGRAYHKGDLLPAKINPNHWKAYVSWGGLEHTVSHYEVLCYVNVAWTNVSGFHIPSNAVVIGSTSHHEKLYMGRTFHDGTLTPGKVQPSHRKLYIPYNGQEIAINNYEIMVYRD